MVLALGVLDWPKEYIKQIDKYILTGSSRVELGAYGLKTPEIIANIGAFYVKVRAIQGKFSSVEIKSKCIRIVLHICRQGNHNLQIARYNEILNLGQSIYYQSTTLFG